METQKNVLNDKIKSEMNKDGDKKPGKLAVPSIFGASSSQS